MMYQCCVPKYYHEDIDNVVRHFTKWWPLLEDATLRDFEKTIKSNEEKVFAKLIVESSSSEDEDKQPDELLQNTIKNKRES